MVRQNRNEGQTFHSIGGGTTVPKPVRIRVGMLRDDRVILGLDGTYEQKTVI